MTWVWFLILGILALVNGRRIAGWVSGWPREALQLVSVVGLSFFGAMALFGNIVAAEVTPFQIAAAALGVLALYTVNEQVRRGNAAKGEKLQSVIDQIKRREWEERRQQADEAVTRQPARAAELLEEQAPQPEPPAAPEDGGENGRYVVIQVDEGDNVRHVAIVGAPPKAAAEEAAAGVDAVADAPVSPEPPPLMPVGEPLEAESAAAEQEPAAADAAQLMATGQQPRPAGPVSLGGGGARRPSGPIRLGDAAGPAPSGPVSLGAGGIQYQPQVDRSRLAPRPDEAAEPADEAEEHVAAEDAEAEE